MHGFGCASHQSLSINYQNNTNDSWDCCFRGHLHCCWATSYSFRSPFSIAYCLQNVMVCSVKPAILIFCDLLQKFLSSGFQNSWFHRIPLIYMAVGDYTLTKTPCFRAATSSILNDFNWILNSHVFISKVWIISPVTSQNSSAVSCCYIHCSSGFMMWYSIFETYVELYLTIAYMRIMCSHDIGYTWSADIAVLQKRSL